MAKRESKDEDCDCCGHSHWHGTSCTYGLGVLGAAVYFISNATSFWMGVWGVVKAFVWPAVLVHGLLKLVGA